MDSKEYPQLENFHYSCGPCGIFTNGDDPLVKYPLADCDGGGTCQQVLYAPADDFSKRFIKRSIEAKIYIKRTG